MKRSTTINRIFNLGDYKSIHISDTIDELPDAFVFNQELMGRIRFLQMVEIEQAFFRYQDFRDKLEKQPNREALYAYIEEVKLNTYEQIKSLMNGQMKE